LKIDTNGVYHITISDKQQSIFKMKATTWLVAIEKSNVKSTLPEVKSLSIPPL